MKIKKAIILSLVPLLGLSLAACSSSKSANKTSTSGTDESNGKQVLNIAIPQEVPSIDLSLVTDTYGFTILNNVYEGIYRLDKNNKTQLAGAEKVEINNDGTIYKVKLNKKARWSDDKPVKAKDYVYGWQRTVNPKTSSEYAYLYNSVKNGKEINEGKKDLKELGIKAINDYELEITLQQATPYFQYLLAMPTFFPQRQDIVEKYGKNYSTTSESSVYNGPFVLANFDGPGTSTKWEYNKNNHYWDKKAVKLDKINFNVVKEAPTALNLFQDKQTDDVILTGELAQQMSNDPNFTSQKQASTSYLEFNQRDENSPYRNKNLRKAISYAVDRKALVNNILGDGSIVPKGLVPADMAKDPKNDKKDFTSEAGDIPTYNKRKAKEYWEKAKKELGIKELKMDILAVDTDSSKKIVEYLQNAITDSLKDVKVSVSTVPFSVRLDRSNKGDFDVVLGAWSADYADPSSFLDLFTTGNAYNRGRYTNKNYNDLVHSAATTNSTHLEKRWKNMIDAEKIIMDDMGVVPIYQKAEAHLRAEKVKGVVAHPAGAQFDYKWTYISE
ncbi:peptide ABC transporter substrate-binding protein [Melissococcus plutonius]|uniref:peptide ABC transporter substrate-binding protein n=1 Tax=Melissococcus plutonius TaxID=33970 RepID=UPI003EE430B2